ncbi:MAG: hypothetical protein KKA64_02460 [Nanoarchaeota archaeon]|nr:hypothetical protein [Nanoarchaeota archaeon]
MNRETKQKKAQQLEKNILKLTVSNCPHHGEVLFSCINATSNPGDIYECTRCRGYNLYNPDSPREIYKIIREHDSK